MKKRLVGQYIVVDTRICHGAPTFRGTRIFVSDVLNMVADGMNWSDIIAECHDSITADAIAEAVRMASEVFVDRVREYDLQPASA